MEAGIPTAACLPTLPQVQALQKAVCPDAGVSRSPPDSQQAGPTPRPHHHPSCHARPACPTSQPASPLLGTPPLARGPAPHDLSCSQQRPRLFFVLSERALGGKSWEGLERPEGPSHGGITAVLIFF